MLAVVAVIVFVWAAPPVLLRHSWTSSSSSPESSSPPEDEGLSDGPDSDQEASPITPHSPALIDQSVPPVVHGDASDSWTIEVQVTDDQGHSLPNSLPDAQPPPRRSARLANSKDVCDMK